MKYDIILAIQGDHELHLGHWEKVRTFESTKQLHVTNEQLSNYSLRVRLVSSSAK